jgi:hypothetical protein
MITVDFIQDALGTIPRILIDGLFGRREGVLRRLWTAIGAGVDISRGILFHLPRRLRRLLRSIMQLSQANETVREIKTPVVVLQAENDITNLDILLRKWYRQETHVRRGVARRAIASMSMHDMSALLKRRLFSGSRSVALLRPAGTHVYPYLYSGETVHKTLTAIGWKSG